MATRTSVKSGLWSAADTWDSGVPVDGDDVVIASGHTVTFNVNQSAFVTGVKITITGTLTHTTNSGTYVMMIKTGDSITGTGTWNIGTSGSPIPYNSKHTITGIAGFRIIGTSGLTINVYGAKPTTRYATLTATAAAGTKVLTVDADVSADLWTSGDIVAVGRYIANNSENNTILSISGNTITLGTNLATAMEAGSVVALVSRNIEFVYTSTGAALFYNFTTSGKLNFDGCCMRSTNAGYCFQTCHYINANGIVTNKFQYPVNTCSWATIANSVFTTPSATILMNSNTDQAYFENCASIGHTICNNNKLVEWIGGIVVGVNYGISFTHDMRVVNLINSAQYALRQMGCNVVLDNVKFNGALTNWAYGDVYSYNHDQVAGAFMHMSANGYAYRQTSVIPDGYTDGYQLYHLAGSPDTPYTLVFPIHAAAGEMFTVEVKLRKSASMTWLPRAIISKGYAGALYTQGSAALDSFTMTNSTDTWETDTFTITNSDSFETVYKLDFSIMNTSGNVYCAYKITRSASGSGGGIPRSRLLGGV